MSQLLVDDIVNKDDTGAPGLSKGVVVTGIATATTFKGNLEGTLPATIGTGVTVTAAGIVSASKYYGDGSELTGVVQSDTPIGNSTASTTFYEIDDNVAITTTTTLTRSSSNPGVIYTKFQSISVGSAPGTVELIVPDGEELVVDAYQLAINTKDI